jgi:hypothetical protein
MTDITFNTAKKLKDVQPSDITQGFKFESGVGNIIKWYMIGLYITNDKVQLEQFHALFNKNGSLHNRRAYKTEAKAVYEALKSGEIKVNNLSLADLSNMEPMTIDVSVGVLYKGLPKAEKEVNPNKERQKVAKQALASENINTDGIVTAKQLLELADGESPFAPIAQQALEQAAHELQLTAYKADFPELNTENLPKIVEVTKQYMSEMYSTFPAEFSEIAMHIMELDTKPVVEKKAA